MERSTLLFTLLSAGAFLLAPGLLKAQGPPSPDIRASMQEIAQSLGVTCNYCHSAARGSGEAEPKKDIAREMMAMTREINMRVESATGHAGAVQCITCHRGVPVPKQLSDIVYETAFREGSGAAVAKYRELRAQFYGRSTYDFGEEALLNAARRVMNRSPKDAIPIYELAIEMFPESSRSYADLAYAYTRNLDDAAAIPLLEKAVELDPDNNVARGRLEQLKSYQRRK
jgi:tetratricopeptide (TPR) repeat protein